METESLTAEAIQSGLPTLVVGKRLFVHKTLPSTMDEAFRLAKDGAPEGTVVLADNQTRGRGRFQRSWLSQPGACVLASIIFRPTLVQLPLLNMAASLAVVRAVRRYPGVRATIKWPNDVLVGGRKLCGMLLDSYLSGDGVEFAVVGIGLNVNMDVQKFPEIAPIATSLSAQVGREVSRLTVVHCLLEDIDIYLSYVKDGAPVQDEWRRNVSTIGQRVKVSVAGKNLEGFAQGVSDNGDLLLRSDDGSVTALSSGEVSLSGF